MCVIVAVKVRAMVPLAVVRRRDSPMQICRSLGASIAACTSNRHADLVFTRRSAARQNLETSCQVADLGLGQDLHRSPHTNHKQAPSRPRAAVSPSPSPTLPQPLPRITCGGSSVGALRFAQVYEVPTHNSRPANGLQLGQ